MTYVCVFLGILSIIGGIVFAFSKIYKKMPTWQKMSNDEKKKINAELLCRNVGTMISLNGIIFILRGFCTAFSEQIFTIAIVIWMVIAVLDVYYISKSKRYKNQ